MFSAVDPARKSPCWNRLIIIITIITIIIIITTIIIFIIIIITIIIIIIIIKSLFTLGLENLQKWNDYRAR